MLITARQLNFDHHWVEVFGDDVRHRRHITMHSNSRFVIATVQRWMVGEDILPEDYITECGNGKTAGLVQG
jgi:hypothetical protein